MINHRRTVSRILDIITFVQGWAQGSFVEAEAEVKGEKSSHYSLDCANSIITRVLLPSSVIHPLLEFTA